MQKIKRFTVAACIVLATLTAPAASYTWTGAGFMGDTDYKWSNPMNWLGLAAPQPGELGVSLTFPNTSAPRNTTNDVLNLGISSITFVGDNYGIYGGSNGVTMTLIGANGGNFAVVSAGNNCQFGASTRLHLGSAGTIAVATGSTLTIRSKISGVFGFTKLSPGTLNLQGGFANTFTGPTTVLHGNLDLRGVENVLPGALIIGDGDLDDAPRVRLYVHNPIGNTSAVTVNRNGQLLLNGYDDMIGALTLARGYVNTGAGTLTLNGNVFVLDSDPGDGLIERSSIRGNLYLGLVSRNFNCADEDSELELQATVSGASYQGGAGIIKNGPGSMTLLTSNSYPGATLVNGGTLVVDHRYALGTTNGYTAVASNAVLELFPSSEHTNNPSITGERLVLHGNSSVVPVHDCEWQGPVELAGGNAVFNLKNFLFGAATFTIDGVISGPGGFDKSGPGAMWLAGSADNTYAGSTYVWNGKLVLYQGGFLFHRVSVPGPLVIGHKSIDLSPPPVVEVWKNETIASRVAVVNNEAQLLLKANTTQTFDMLAVNTGVVDSGPGLLRLAGSIASTNDFPGGEIRGRLDLGDAPRTIRIQDYRLKIPASISGGPNATLQVLGAAGGYVDFLGSNSYGGLTIISSGGIAAHNSNSLGVASSGVIVTNTGTLLLSGALTTNIGENFTITKAFLHLNANMVDVSYSALHSSGSNVWKSPIWLGTNTRVRSSGTLRLVGAVSGPGGLKVLGPGELVLAGVGVANTYAGPTEVEGATLTLAKSSGPLTSLAVPGDVTLSSFYYGFPYDLVPGRLRLAANAQLQTNAHVAMESDSILECGENATNSIASFSGLGDVEFRPGSLLRAGFDNANFLFSGHLMGGDPSAPTAVRFEKHGWGVLSLWGQHSLTGAVDVVQGNLSVRGNVPNALAIARPGATVAGPGAIGSVRVEGGTFWPGGGEGDMSVRSCTGGIAGLHPKGVLKVNLYGATAQAGSDCLQVQTLVDVENLTLNFSPGAFAVPVGEQFVMITNQSGSAVLGRLNHPGTGQDLTEGDMFFANGKRFSISYVGGNGNDVVLTRETDPAPAQIGSISQDPDGMFLNVSGEPGLVYQVEANFDLNNSGGWTQIGAVTMNSSGFANFIDGDSKSYPMRFYRFRFVAP